MSSEGKEEEDEDVELCTVEEEEGYAVSQRSSEDKSMDEEESIEEEVRRGAPKEKSKDQVEDEKSTEEERAPSKNSSDVEILLELRGPAKGERERSREGKRTMSRQEDDQKKPRNHRMPSRVEVIKRKKDHKGRDNIPVLRGEMEEIVQRLDRGANSMQKIITFRAVAGSPVINAYAYVREDQKKEREGDLEKEMHHLRKLVYQQGDKYRIIENALEIGDIARENGDEEMEELLYKKQCARCWGGPLGD